MSKKLYSVMMGLLVSFFAVSTLSAASTTAPVHNYKIIVNNQSDQSINIRAAWAGARVPNQLFSKEIVVSAKSSLDTGLQVFPVSPNDAVSLINLDTEKCKDIQFGYHNKKTSILYVNVTNYKASCTIIFK